MPEITDYEVRRELLRAGSLTGVARLDQQKITAGFLPITTEAMLKAAEFWAQARQQEQPTAADAALDGDVVLAAQAVVLAAQEVDRVVLATANLAHLSRFTDADLKQNIVPSTP
ncbi:MAG TPA: hypothetical protein VF120_12140 [Ktedonobacterales bacterium]